MMPRLDRRIAILKGKRNGAFDRDQYYLEGAQRARLARKARALLRGMRPVALVTPRWSEPQQFLDDVAVDLLLGEPVVRSRMLSLRSLRGRTTHQAWTWLVQAVSNFTQQSLPGPAWQVVDRHGFDKVMENLLSRTHEGERTCLMIHGLEHLNTTARDDLLAVLAAHAAEGVARSGLNFVLAGAVNAQLLTAPRITSLVLPDFSVGEAVESLVEYLGVDDLQRLRDVVELVGGVPEVLHMLGTDSASRINDIVHNRHIFWNALGLVGSDILRTFREVTADDALSLRLDRIAQGPQAVEADADDALIRAGLCRQTRDGRQTMLRAPVFADLADLV